MTGNIKCACTNFYEQDAVKFLLGESFHPGGVDLTAKLGQLLGLHPADKVLDVASGQGTSAIFLAQTVGCTITGIDLSLENIKVGQQKAAENNLVNVFFRPGDAEKLPAANQEFSVVVSECAFCTFPDKQTAAEEMFRVLKPGGKVGITDMIVDQDSLPEAMKTLLYQAACIADAHTAEEYLNILGAVGFQNLQFYDHSYTLTEMINNVRKRLLMAELAVGLKKLDLGELDFAAVKKMLAEAEGLVKKGIIGYVIITGEKEGLSYGQK
ncbi:MAG: methyltransferase domain-containing protein [Carboxydocellales bacterium]